MTLPERERLAVQVAVHVALHSVIDAALRTVLSGMEWYSCAICGQEFEQLKEATPTHICEQCESELRMMEEILAEEEAKIPRTMPKPVEDEKLERRDAER